MLILAAANAVLPSVARSEDDPVHTILFGSMEAGSATFAGSGAKIAPGGTNREGFAALVSVGGGIRQERGAPAAPTLVRTSLVGAALGGYQFFYDWGVVGLFAGPEASFEAISGSDGFLALPLRYGVRAQGELWARPSENTLTTATLIVGSARTDLYARVSAGYRLWGAYLGPEGALYGDRTGYWKASAGLHATEVRFGRFNFRVSAGCLYEAETRRFGPYFALATWVPL